MHFYTLICLTVLSTSTFALPNMVLDAVHSNTASIEIRTDSNYTSNSTLVPNHFIWKAPTKEDFRSPCPMLNTLANHGFLPHNGRHITREIFNEGVFSALRIDQAARDVMFNAAITVNPEANATSFDLGMLHVRPFIEHDGSTAMQDPYLDVRNIYHEPTFANFMRYITDAASISIPAAANAKARHMHDMSKLNPRFTLLRSQVDPVYMETASMFLMWGGLERRVMRRDWFEFFFRNARLPVELGWAPPQDVIPFDAEVAVILPQLKENLPKDVPLLYNPGDPDF